MQDGVEIYKRFYPWPEAFRLGDPVLVRAVTDMSWPQFVQALQEQEDAISEAEEAGADPPEPDQVVLAGLIAVAFWHGNPQMSRDKARRAIERIPVDEIELISGDFEGDVSPPAVADGTQPSGSSSASADSQVAQVETATLPASTSEETSLNGSGLPGLPSALPVSRLP